MVAENVFQVKICKEETFDAKDKKTEKEARFKPGLKALA
jgi:hypothetical protein